jgi:hypothetical protein
MPNQSYIAVQQTVETIGTEVRHRLVKGMNIALDLFNRF